MKRYSEEEIKVYIKLYHGGQAVTSLCKEYGFSRSSLFGWIQKYKDLPPPNLFVPKDILIGARAGKPPHGKPNI